MSDRGERIARLAHAVEGVKLARRPDTPTWQQAWRARQRWFRRWDDFFEGLYLDLQGRLPLEDLLVEARRLWAQTQKRRVSKEHGDFPITSYEELLRRVRIQLDQTRWVDGALTALLGVALDMGEDAGQFTLDALGIDRTFAWANRRNTAQALYAVRGSKVVQGTYGAHLGRLTELVVQATDPARPLPMGELVKQVQQEWGQLARWQAERIARTEAAAVWETTNVNVMRANGIESFDSLIATGPSIGVESAAVDQICVDIALSGPYRWEDNPETPPYHPNCRCTLVPIYDMADGSHWLPPDEPWVGGDLPTFDLEDFE